MGSEMCIRDRFIGIYAGAFNTLPGKMYAFGFIVAVAMLYLLAHELSE